MKQRANKLDPFSGRIKEWAAEGKTLAAMREQLKADGCSCSLSSLSDYLARCRQELLEANLFAQIASGGRMNREMDAAYAANPAPEIERLIQVSKTLVMSLQVKGVGDTKMLGLANSMQQTVLNYLSGRTRAELEARKIELAESKYRDQVAERKRAIELEIGRARAGGITAETLERIEAELKLL